MSSILPIKYALSNRLALCFPQAMTVTTMPHKLLIVTTAGTICKFRSDEKKVSVFSVNSLKAIGVPLASIHLLTYRGPGP